MIKRTSNFKEGKFKRRSRETRTKLKVNSFEKQVVKDIENSVIRIGKKKVILNDRTYMALYSYAEQFARYDKDFQGRTIANIFFFFTPKQLSSLNSSRNMDSIERKIDAIFWHEKYSRRTRERAPSVAEITGNYRNMKRFDSAVGAQNNVENSLKSVYFHDKFRVRALLNDAYHLWKNK